MLPGTTLSLDWGSARCQGKAIVVGNAQALVLSPESLRPGTRLEIENEATGERASFSVIWCSTADADGHCKLGLQIIEDTGEPGSSLH